jgi:hypothetical protein
MCEVLLDTTTSTDYPYILGAPFFRQYQVMMNYTSNQVGIISKTSTSPVTSIDKFPTPNSNISATTTLTLDSGNEVYSGAMALGGASNFQNSSKVMFDTLTETLIVISKNCSNCTNGWFN